MDLCCGYRIFTLTALGLIVLAPQCFHAALATTFIVGDSDGWVVGVVNYTEWAAKHTFHAGDTLVFNYLKQYHTVVEVTKDSYTTCNSKRAIESYDDGNTAVMLPKAGTYYYICGVTGHCPAGQKIEVVVLAKSAAEAQAPSPIAGGASSPATTGGAPAGPGRAGSTPSSNNGATRLGRSGVVVLMLLLQLLKMLL